MPVPTRRLTLPYDLFENIIIPDLLSEHLHSLVMDRNPSKWPAFYVLPLVSPDFNKTCRKLMPVLVGIPHRTLSNNIGHALETPDLENDDEFEELEEEVEPLVDSRPFSDDVTLREEENSSDPRPLLDYARLVCELAFRPSSNMTQTHHYFNEDILMSNRSLVQVYICFAIGKTLLNLDILRPLGILRGTIRGQGRTPWDEDFEETEEEGLLSRTPAIDSNFYRCFMPFWCAQKLCDLIVPNRLAYYVASFMGKVLPFYHSVSVFIKFAMDLRFDVERNYVMDLSEYASWALKTLKCLENSEELLETMLKSGKLVRSCCTHEGIPQETLRVTETLKALDDVMKADWGETETTATIRRRARILIKRWMDKHT